MKLRDILSTLSSASEFEIIPVRETDVPALHTLNELIKFPIVKEGEED